VCGVVCLLLIVLWVRSYWKTDFFGNIGAQTSFAFQQGHILIQPSVRYHPDGLPIPTKGISGIVAADVVIPIWLLIILNAALATLPWTSWRFSLRTLLIATTVLAVVLGFIVLVAKS